MERDARDSAGRCAALEQEFPWIAGEKQLFGCALCPHALLQVPPKQALGKIIRGAIPLHELQCSALTVALTSIPQRSF